MNLKELRTMKKGNLKILITGACGVTSRSVIRSLLSSHFFSNCTFIGTDICENVYGLYEHLFDRIYRVPNYKSPKYQEVMVKIITNENIDAAIIIPELEVIEWAKYKFPTKYIIPPLGFCERVINKANLYEYLQGSGFVPKYDILSREDILNKKTPTSINLPFWMRDFSSGSTSGKGALRINTIDEAWAWAIINSNINNFMVTELLPGRNFACHLLYYKNQIIKIASYERLEYFMAKIVPSGITGNISKGKLVNNPEIVEVSSKAISLICEATKEEMNGIVAVDLKSDQQEKPFITEINIRHVAATSSFALAGFNLSEYHLLLALDELSNIPILKENTYPENNLIIRDIDGNPIWIESFTELKIGEYR